MLRLHPDKRAKAAELIHHKWLDGVLVQGEIDVIRRAEGDEEERRRRATSSAPQGVSRSSSAAPPAEGTRQSQAPGKRVEGGLTQSEVDAMKPVDDAGRGGGGGSGESAAASPSPNRDSGVPRLGAVPASAGAKENSGASRTNPVQVQGASPARGGGAGQGGKRRS